MVNAFKLLFPKVHLDVLNCVALSLNKNSYMCICVCNNLGLVQLTIICANMDLHVHSDEYEHVSSFQILPFIINSPCTDVHGLFFMLKSHFFKICNSM